MTIAWKYSKLGDFVETQKGFAFKSSWYCDSGKAIVKVSDFTQDSIDCSNLVCIPEEIAINFRKYVLEKDDVIVQTVGSWPTNPSSVVGKCIRVPQQAAGALLNQNAVKLIPYNDLDSRYLFYLLRNEVFGRYIVGTAQGAASQAAITLDSIRSFQFFLPPLPTQRRIAAILSAYDELIENNTRRIRLLEQMAQMIYREWFVKFRFPGHEGVRLVETEVGVGPEGWSIVNLETLYNTASGGTPSRKVGEYFGGPVRWVKTRELNDGFIFDTEEGIADIALKNSSAKVFPENTVLIAMYGATIGKLGILAKPAATNQACCALLPQNDIFGYSYIFLYLLENRNDIINLGLGAAQQNISQVVIRNFRILKPPEKLMRIFNQTVNELLNLIKNLQAKNANLRQTRDLLLPKLVSGEVDP